MKRLKKPVCILLVLCSAAMACNREDPIRRNSGEKRLVAPRLSDAQWQECCAPAEVRETCPEPNSRMGALKMLAVAHGQCLDNTLRAIEKHAPEDLAAAYLIRAERNDTPVDLLHALKTAQGFNRALALERLGLTREAIHAWDQVVREPGWGREAVQYRDQLQKLSEPAWNGKEVEQALQRRDRATLTRIAQAFPYDAAVFFLESGLLDREAARLFADVLADGGEPYPQRVVEAMERTADRDALERGLRALHAGRYERAATLLERAGNPLHLYARYRIAGRRQQKALPLLDALARATPPDCRTLLFRIHSLRATVMEDQGRYFDAHAAYAEALRFADGDPTRTVIVLNRRSANYATIGNPERAFGDSVRAIGLLPRVARLKEIHQAYGSAAMAAQELEYADVALHYQNEVVRLSQKAVGAAEGDDLAEAKHNLAVALRKRAEIHAVLADLPAAEADLVVAEELAEAADLRDIRPLLRMRVREARGDTQLEKNPGEAVVAFTEAIVLAQEQNSTYRAILYSKRAEARRRAGDARAEDDVITAFAILRDEAKQIRDASSRGDYEDLWTSYFSRFQKMYHEAIERSVARGDHRGAFVLAEQARAFEPIHLLLQSKSVPKGFHPIEEREGLEQRLADLPQDTAILQYVVLPEKTYAWVLTRGGIKPFELRPGKKQVERWRAEVAEAVAAGQSDPFTRTMRAVYGELFRAPLAASGKASRIVIVPDGAMHGLPFAGLQGRPDERYLIERASIATAGSTSLYLYARARDGQFGNRPPSVLLAADPALDLKNALPEVQDLQRDYYPGAELLTGADATVSRFLAAAKKATIVHFAGHGIANPQSPWKSRLLLAPHGNETGELTAESLMRELSELERTRLIVLGACSTAGGQPVGPEGLAPLVRPLIAANVPAVVGTLWDVKDATAKDLLVSLHCHYRHGDDVADALRAAQLERLQIDEPAMTWAPYQVVGYAASPYPRRVPMEKDHSEHLCTQDSLHRPDGLHSQ